MHTRKSLEPCKTGRRLAPGAGLRNRSPAPAAVTFAVSLSLSGAALAGPTGGAVVSGQGSISTPNSSTTVINQSSQQLSLNWNTFNVASNESVLFRQPSSSAIAFNRILDQNPSQIFGHIQGNGQVVLVNPNGFLIGRTATLNVNSLVVSSLDAIDFDAASGRYRFSSTTDPGAIVNQGSITAGRGGSVTLLGGSVSNSGSIVADFGTVNLAAGRTATIDLAGDGLLRLEVNSDLTSNHGGAGSAVENSGTISANGGQVVLTANAVKDVFTNLVNNTGVVRASRIDDTGGVIQLLGPGGTVVSSGTLDASAGDATSSGGTVAMVGERVGLLDNAVVNVAGATNGGTALIGGDEHGANPNVLNAQLTYVSPGATINADAGAQGNGGRVIVWSDDATRFDGQLSARGGSLAGDGGFAEVSGKQNLQFNGSANLTAAHGTWGTLLLDPDQIVIDNSNTDPANLDADHIWDFGEDTGVLPAGTVGASKIANLLKTGSVTLNATNDITQNLGADIDVHSAGGAAGSALSLNSKGTIELNGNISLNAGDVNVTASNDISLSGSITTTGTGVINVISGVSPPATAPTSGTSKITLSGGSSLTTGTGAITLHSLDAISLGGTVSTGTSATITSDNGGIDNGGSTGTRIDALVASLSAGGNIGSGSVPLGTNTTQFTTLKAGTSGNIFIDNSGSVTLSSVNPGVTTPGGLTVTSDNGSITLETVKADSVTLTASNGGVDDDGTGTGMAATHLTVTSGAEIGTLANPIRTTQLGTLQAISGANGIVLTNTDTVPGSTLTLGGITANGAGNDITISNAGYAIVNSGLLTKGGALTLTGSAIGDPFSPLATQVSSLNATATNGGVFDHNSGDLTVTKAHAAGVFDDIIITAVATTTPASAGDILVKDINTPGNVTLTADGAIQNASGSVALVAGTSLTLTANGGSIGGSGVGAQIVANTPSVSASATTTSGGIYIEDQAAFALTNATATGSGNDIVITGDAGNMTVGTVSASNSVTLTAASPTGGLVDDGNDSTRISATSVTLNAGTSIGAAGAPNTMDTSAGSLSATANNGGVFVSNQGDLTITKAHASGGGSAITIGTVATTVPATAGNLLVKDISAPGAVTVSADGSIQNASGSLAILGSSLTMTAGNAIGGAGGGQQIVTNAGTVSASTTTNGGIYVEDQGAFALTNATATGSGNDVVIKGDAGNITVGTVSANHAISLTATTGALVDDANDATKISTNLLTLTAGTSIGATGLHNDMDTAVTSLSATANNGGVYATNTGALGGLALPSVRSLVTGDVVVTTDGNVTAGTVSSLNNVTIGSGGALTDDGNTGTSISGPGSVTLSAASAIGNVTTFATLSGTPISLSSNGAVKASVSNPTGQIYLDISGAPTFAANSISLGGGAASSGAVILQSANSLDVGSLGSGVIQLGNGNTASLGLSSGNILTLPAAGTVTDFPASTILVHGTNDVVGTGGTRAFSFNANALNFQSGAQGGATTLTTTVGTFDANIGNNQALTVHETGSMTIGTVSAGSVAIDSSGGMTVGTVTGSTGSVGLSATNMTVNSVSGNGVNLAASAGGMTLGTVNGNSGNVTISATGAVADDGNDATLITGNLVTIGGSALGASGTHNELDTQAGTLNATATSGGIYVGEADSLTLSANASGGPVVVSTAGANSGITLTGVTSTSDITLTAGTAGNRGAISQTGGVITGQNMTVTGSSIGSSGARLNTSVSSLNATAENGGIYVTQGPNLALTASATGGAVDVQSTGAMTVGSASGTGVTLTTLGDGNALTTTGPVNGGTGVVALTASGAGSPVSLGGSVTTSGNLTVTAGSSASRGAITSIGGQISAASLTAVGASIGASGATLNTTVASLDATASSGGIFVQEADGLNLTASATGGAVQVGTTNGTLTASTVSGTGVSLTAGGSGSSLILNGAVSAGTGNVSLTAGSALVANAGNQVSGANATIRAAGVGTQSAKLNTAVDSLDVATTNGGIFVNEADALALTAAATNGATDVRTGNGSLTVASASGNGLTLVAGGSGNLALNGATSAGAGDATLTAGGAIVGSSTDSVTGGTVTLSGTAIGASGTPINTTATALNATSSNGGIFLNEHDAATLTASATGGALNVQAGGALTVASASGDGVTLAAAGSGSGITLNGSVNGGTGAVTLNAGGALVAGAGVQVSGGGLTATGTAIGSSANPLTTTVGTLNATSTAGGIYVNEADALTLTASAAGGPVNVQTGNGALVVNGASGNAVSLIAGGAGSGITVAGAVNAGSGDVTLTAGTTSSRGAIVAGAGNSVAGGTLTADGSTIGSSSAALNTKIDTLNANATQGGIYLSEQNGLSLANVHSAGDVSVSSATGDITVHTLAASNNVSLTASSGAIADDGDDTTLLTGKGVTLLAQSIGAPSTLTASVLNIKPRLDIQATTLDATATNGGIYLNALNGLASASVHATGGTGGNIELLAPNGDLNLLKVSATNTLLLAAGGNILGLPGLGTITARSAELRAGGSDPTTGHIGTLAQPLSLQLDAGNTLHIYVPTSIDSKDSTRAPSTLPSVGVSTTLSTFSAPDVLSVQAGFGQFQGLSDTLFTSPAEALVRSIQNQTATVQSVVGIDWASFNPNVSLFGTLDPSVCLPSDQRDEEQGGAACK